MFINKVGLVVTLECVAEIEIGFNSGHITELSYTSNFPFKQVLAIPHSGFICLG